MNIIIAKDYDEVCDIAAAAVKNTVINNPRAVLGFATGSTQLGVYKRLVEFYAKGELSFKNCVSFNLDEYVGANKYDKHSYAYYMEKNLFGKTDFDPENTHLPCGIVGYLDAECDRYSRLLKEHPRDIQLLGLGSDGHIGFNEPGTAFELGTHMTELAKSTIADNARLFARKEDVPQRAVTMGISEILAAKKILVLATGESKAQAVYGMVKGEVSTDCPASALQNHADVDIIVDGAAASLIL